MQCYRASAALFQGITPAPALQATDLSRLPLSNAQGMLIARQGALSRYPLNVSSHSKIGNVQQVVYFRHFFRRQRLFAVAQTKHPSLSNKQFSLAGISSTVAQNQGREQFQVTTGGMASVPPSVSANTSCSSTTAPHPTHTGGEGLTLKTVVTFYKFADLSSDAQAVRRSLQELCDSLPTLSGFILVATEGVNGNISGDEQSVEAVFHWLESDARLAGLRRNYSPVEEGEKLREDPFRWEGVRVRCKAEVVTMGVPGISPSTAVGEYVPPKDWNSLISDPDTIVIDVRNDYETQLGHFKGAMDPSTQSFREFPGWVQKELLASDSSLESNMKSSGASHPMEQETHGQRYSSKSFQHLPPSQNGRSNSAPDSFLTQEGAHFMEPLTEAGSEAADAAGREGSAEESGLGLLKDKKVAMYCTGGIRCEKATSLMMSLGFKKVFHLDGGILSYLREVPEDESLWEGECFVFDKRVSVRNGLQPGTHRLCHACKRPVNEEDMLSPHWVDGVSCPYCFQVKSDKEKARAKARHEQFKRWGRVGGPLIQPMQRRKLKKAQSI